MLKKETKALIRKYLKKFELCSDLRTLKKSDYNRVYNDFEFRKYAGLPTRGYKSKLKPKRVSRPTILKVKVINIQKRSNFCWDLALFTLFTVMYALILTLFYNLLGLEAVVISAFAVILGYLFSNVGGR
jgi:hypothetical protein